MDSDSKENGVVVWNGIMKAALALPGAKVARISFLYSQLRSHCNAAQVQKAIEEGPANAEKYQLTRLMSWLMPALILMC